ncbi:MAG: PD-(D/E)XK nuclease family protein [Planctomycetes bacterium]|nr:PD-(D/E)XK nuclease family protein [Planctomycetota bacterium]
MAFRIAHELSWSASRASTLASCPRRYYWDYYGSWLGWDASGDPERRQAWLLKKMTRMPMLAGQIVHDAIQRWFELRRSGGEPPEREAFIAAAVAELRRHYKDSRDGKWRQRPAKITHLAEHHYAEPRIDEGTGEAATYGATYRDRIVESLTAFLEMPELEEVRSSDPGSWLACEDMSTFDVEGVKVYAVPDFAWRDAEGVVHIWDWKTGSPRDADRFQLEVYAGYARDFWDADPERVVGYDAYLRDRRVVEVRPGSAGLEQAYRRILESLAEMRASHFDAGETAGDPEQFPRVEDARPCASCNYRELCGRG